MIDSVKRWNAHGDCVEVSPAHPNFALYEERFPLKQPPPRPPQPDKEGEKKSGKK
jgi:hypothetical protein